jgi:hypothetical protein
MKTKLYKRKFNEYSKKLFTYKGRNFFDIEHSIDRFKERFPEYTIEDYITVAHRGIDLILDLFKDSKGKYIIVSKSKYISLQIEWRLDKKGNDRKNHGFSATTLDYRIHKKEMKGDTKLFVEDYKKHKLECGFYTTDYKQMIKETGYYDIKIKECPDYKVYIKEGKIYKNFTIIEIE